MEKRSQMLMMREGEGLQTRWIKSQSIRLPVTKKGRKKRTWNNERGRKRTWNNERGREPLNFASLFRISFFLFSLSLYSCYHLSVTFTRSHCLDHIQTKNNGTKQIKERGANVCIYLFVSSHWMRRQACHELTWIVCTVIRLLTMAMTRW